MATEALNADHASAQPSVGRISVVIPTLNAAAHVSRTIALLTGTAEVIVADGGSTDRTPDLAAATGARIICASTGRGTQLAAGVEAATQPWLLLLHADTTLSANWRTAVAAHIATRPTHAGYFRFILDSPSRSARRLERIVAWRSRVLALPYGDQGLLIHRDLLREVGGIRPIPLMEDVHLVRRIGRRRLIQLQAAAITSAERYERAGYFRRSARNLLCLSLWFLGVPPVLIRRLYA